MGSSLLRRESHEREASKAKELPAVVLHSSSDESMGRGKARIGRGGRRRKSGDVEQEQPHTPSPLSSSPQAEERRLPAYFIRGSEMSARDDLSPLGEEAVVEPISLQLERSKSLPEQRSEEALSRSESEIKSCKARLEPSEAVANPPLKKSNSVMTPKRGVDHLLKSWYSSVCDSPHRSRNKPEFSDV